MSFGVTTLKLCSKQNYCEVDGKKSKNRNKFLYVQCMVFECECVYAIDSIRTSKRLVKVSDVWIEVKLNVWMRVDAGQRFQLKTKIRKTCNRHYHH